MDYTGDNSTQKSVTGYIVLRNIVAIAWRSQSQKTVTLYVTEAEYSEVTEICFEILLIRAILLFVGVVVEYSIAVHIDSVGAILLSENTLVSQQRKHIDIICHHFIRDCVEDRTVRIKFVPSEENLVYVFTNNLSYIPQINNNANNLSDKIIDSPVIHIAA